MRPLRRLLPVVSAAVLAAPLLPATPASAQFVPSCLSGVRVPQLCTLAVAIAGSGVAPGSTSQLTGRVTSSVTRTHGDCPAGVRSYLEQYEGTVAGPVRGVASSGILLLEMRGCADGQLFVVAAIDAVADQRTSSGTRRTRHDVVVKLRQVAGSSEARMEYVWDTSTSDCTTARSCTPVSQDRSSAPAGTSVPVAIRNTGMAARYEHETTTTTYSGGTPTSTTSPGVFEIGASVSGRWARTTHTVTRGGASRVFRATVKPDPGLWRVGVGS